MNKKFVELCECGNRTRFPREWEGWKTCFVFHAFQCPAFAQLGKVVIRFLFLPLDVRRKR